MEKRHASTMQALRATVSALATAAGDETQLASQAPPPITGPSDMRSDPNRGLREELASLQVLSPNRDHRSDSLLTPNSEDAPLV